MILTLCAGCWTTADAQSTFTQRLQQSRAGEGKVTVHHDAAIDQLVNGSGETVTPTVSKPTEAKPTETKPTETTKPTTTTTTPVSSAVKEQVLLPDTSNHKKVSLGQKITGYRIQLFAGGNSRKDRLEAERVGAAVRSQIPGTPVYVHYYNPRWICRVGNYRTYEEAHAQLVQFRGMGYQQAIIVKGKITVKN